MFGTTCFSQKTHRRFLFFIVFSTLLLSLSSPALAASCSHASSTWKTTSTYITSGCVFQSKFCDFCGKTLDTRIKAIPMHENGRFVFTPNQFNERLDKLLCTLNEYYDAGSYQVQIDTMDDNALICAVSSLQGKSIAGIQFTDENTYLKDGEQDNQTISCIMSYFVADDMDAFVDICMGIVLTCDSSLEVSDAKDILQSAMLSTANGKPYRHHGVGYAFSSFSSGGYLFVASLLDK